VESTTGCYSTILSSRNCYIAFSDTFMRNLELRKPETNAVADGET
jgi:hypothetical protein